MNKIFVIEGTDGSGKSTQINLLSRWIEDKSYGCMVSEWKTSRLIANVIDDAKDRNLLNATTFSLLYAADFAEFIFAKTSDCSVKFVRVRVFTVNNKYCFFIFVKIVVNIFFIICCFFPLRRAP